MNRVIILITLTFALCPNLFAQNFFDSGGLRFVMNDYGYNTVTVFQLEDSVHCDALKYIVIPAFVENNGVKYEVTDLGLRAFADNTDIVSIIIENGIKYIESEAFVNCISLKSLVIPPSVEVIGERIVAGCNSLKTINVDKHNKRFDSRDNCNAIICGNELIAGCNNTIIPKGVTSIGNRAFSKCFMLKEVKIPEGVRKIARRAFEDCINLEYLSFPNSMEILETEAFFNCISLRSMHIPGNLKSIHDGAFNGCDNLKNLTVDKTNEIYDSRNECNAVIITETNTLVAGSSGMVIPNSVTNISSASCQYLAITNLCIPKSVILIENGAFIGCDKLTFIAVDTENPMYDSRNDCNAIIETATNKMMVGCTNTIFPKDIEEIADLAFEGLNSPRILMFNKGIRKIGNFAFAHCDNLEEVFLPNSVEQIGAFAFYASKNLNHITMPDGVKVMHRAFDGCSSLYLNNKQ